MTLKTFLLELIWRKSKSRFKLDYVIAYGNKSEGRGRDVELYPAIVNASTSLLRGSAMFVLAAKTFTRRGKKEPDWAFVTVLRFAQAERKSKRKATWRHKPLYSIQCSN